MDILEQLQKELIITGEHQPRAVLWGLGGVGSISCTLRAISAADSSRKSEIAIQYAYWHRKTYPEQSIFWIHASNLERFCQSFSEIARERKIPGYEDPNADHLSLVKRWLNSELNGEWLMIIDNANDLETFFGVYAMTADSRTIESTSVRKYIPNCAHGALLVTTRNKFIRQKITRSRSLIKVDPINKTESAELFRRQLKGETIEPDTLEELMSELEGLPLALSQAAVFAQMNSLPLHEYLKLYKQSDETKIRLLSEFFGSDTVTATLMISLEHIKRTSPCAARILSLMAVLDRQGLPVSLISGEASDEIELVNALGTLKAFSLISSNAANDMFDMHGLVHLITRNWLRLNGEFEFWATSSLKLMWEKFPSGDYSALDTCDLYFPHAKAALSYVHLLTADDFSIAHLLLRISQYRHRRIRYDIASAFDNWSLSGVDFDLVYNVIDYYRLN